MTKDLRIDALRVPLIVLVVFIHMNPTFERLGYWGFTINTVAQVAVPCFFVIAGYFFVGSKPLTWASYGMKLKKRVQSLLIPYLLWNLVPSLVYVAGNLFSMLFRGKSSDALMAFLTDLWNDGLWHLWWDKVNGMPSDSPLWFLRDLIVMCLLVPVFYFFIKKCGKYMIIVLFFLYVLLPLPLKSVPGISLTAIFFFSIGLYLRFRGIGLINKDRKYQWGVVGITLFLLALILMFRHQVFLYPLFIVIGTYGSFVLIGRTKENIVKWLASFSPTVFFIYAVHQTFVLAQVGKIVDKVLPDAYWADVIAYLTVPFLATAVCMAMYHVMRYVCPRILAVLCGGRV